MNLLTESRILAGWILQVLGQCLRVARRTTFSVIACSLISRITRMLTFLLPLKVILLAGSEGVPSYFRVVLSPDSKDAGVIALSAAAIGSYAVTLLLEAREKRLTEVGSADLLAASGAMSVVSNQQMQAQGFYKRFTRIAAATLFTLAGLLVLAALDTVLAACLLVLCLCFYLLTTWALHGVTPLRRTRLSDLDTDRLGDYLNILSTDAFLSSFLVILHPFVMGTNGNILVAIICIVLLRQLLSAATGSIKDAVSLIGQRQLIDTLVFPEHKLEAVEARNQRTLRDLFGRRDREKTIAEELAGLTEPGQTLHIEWRDPAVQGMAEFSIAVRGGGGARHFRQRVYPPHLRRMIENEDLLFHHIDREAVWAPAVARRFSHGEHECVVYEVGADEMPTPERWRALQLDLHANLWCVEPPPALVRVYCASHRFLHERLTDEFVARMDIAIDSDEEAETFGRFREALPAMREIIGELPPRLVNRGIVREQTVTTQDGGVRLLHWGQWSLEPIGAGLAPPLVTDAKVNALLDKVRRRAPGMAPPSVTPEHLQLARKCGLLERAILRGAMKSGLGLMEQVMADLDSVRGNRALHGSAGR